MTDLFDIPESLSPYEAFKRRHGIAVSPTFADPRFPWEARVESQDICKSGVTEKDAVFNLADQHNLAGMDGVNWD